MRLAFSNIACSDLDLNTLIAKAGEWGYQGVELKHFEGRFDLTESPTLKHDPDAVRARFADAGVKLVALNTSLSFCESDARKLAENKAKVREYIRLAGRIGAEHVIVCGDVLSGKLTRPRAIQQSAAVLRDLALEAAEHSVTIAFENMGDLASSRDAWTLNDAVRFPSVGLCWNQINAQMLLERPSISIPRVGHALSIVRATDARLTDDRLIESYVEIGKGHLEAERMIELLKGVAFDGWLCVEWPRLWQPGLAPPERILPAYGKFLKERVDSEPVVLSAYKGDKNAPTFVSRDPEPAPAS